MNELVSMMGFRRMVDTLAEPFLSRSVRVNCMGIAKLVTITRVDR